MRNEYLIKNPGNDNWLEIAALIADSIPNALISKLGPRFGALYYKSIAEHRLACCYMASNKEGRIVGIILGTADRKATKLSSFALRARLLVCANIRLFKPEVMKWILTGLCLKSKRKYEKGELPRAELMDVVVHKDFQGLGIAKELINKMEHFFKINNAMDPYLILTEKSNLAANNVYMKLGASLIQTYFYHDKVINEWHKPLS